MELEYDFAFRPLPEIPDRDRVPFHHTDNQLGPLKDLPGTWTGTGFNQIWRPFRDLTKLPASGPNPPPNQDRFLELNLTQETLQFEVISGAIPNRGLLQADMNMFGLTYLQQISDANVVTVVNHRNVHAGLHIEPGIWITVPATLVLGERDMMTPARAGKALAAALPNSRTEVLRSAGHMMMVERPDELLAALQG